MAVNLATAKSQLDTINYLNLGHNSLRANANIEQMFSMISDVLKPIIVQYATNLSDINIAKYGLETIDPTKVNICWKEMLGHPGKYMILLFPVKNAVYINITTEIQAELLTSGFSNGWYLLNQIDCLNVAIQNVDTTFNVLLNKTIETLFNKHENDTSISAHYAAQFRTNITTKADIEQIASNLQSTALNVQLANAQLNYFTTSNNDTICSIADYLNIQPVTSSTLSYFARSKYLLNNIQYSAFIENSAKQKVNKNVFCYFAHRDFSDLGLLNAYASDNYLVNSQAIGQFKILFDTNASQLLNPVCPPVPINKTNSSITFFLMLKLDINTFVKITDIDYSNIGIAYSLTGKLMNQLI